MELIQVKYCKIWIHLSNLVACFMEETASWPHLHCAPRGEGQGRSKAWSLQLLCGPGLM